MRLTRKLSHRDKLFATAIALTQIAVGSLVILDYKFILIIIAAFILIPKAFFEMNLDLFKDKTAVTASSVKFKMFKNRTTIAIIMLTTAIIFLFFPRNLVRSGGITFFRNQGVNLKDDELNMSGLKGTLSEDLLFQIEGKGITYLKTFALDTFNGSKWIASEFSNRKYGRVTRNIDNKNSLRRITIRNNAYRPSTLPSDGYVTGLNGNFFSRAYLTFQDSIRIFSSVSIKGRKYEYSTELNKCYKGLYSKEKKICLNSAGSSSALRKLSMNLTDGIIDNYKKAIVLKNYFSKGFTYNYKPEELTKGMEIDEFVFNSKDGHCERYASALAVMLRTVGIPSRVAVGYLANSKNTHADIYNIRIKDAHAWTEAYIKGRGWSRFDATPPGVLSELSRRNIGFYLTISDWFEYIWYSKIVNYNFDDQKALVFNMENLINDIVEKVADMYLFLPFVLVILLFAYVVILLKKKKRYKFHHRFDGENVNNSESVYADHFYSKVLKILAAKRLYRKPHQTPLEFLYITKNNYPIIFKYLRHITFIFYRIKYGKKRIDINSEVLLEKSIEGIKKNKNKLQKYNKISKN